MRYDIVEAILSNDLEGAKSSIEEYLHALTNGLIDGEKRNVAGRVFGEGVSYSRRSAVRRIGRVNLARIRIRHGKIQRRKKYSAIKGWTYRGGHMKRIRPSERLHRRLAARRAKIKRRAKRSIIRRKTMIAMRKRRALGLSYKPFGRS